MNCIRLVIPGWAIRCSRWCSPMAPGRRFSPGIPWTSLNTQRARVPKMSHQFCHTKDDTTRDERAHRTTVGAFIRSDIRALPQERHLFPHPGDRFAHQEFRVRAGPGLELLYAAAVHL